MNNNKRAATAQFSTGRPTISRRVFMMKRDDDFCRYIPFILLFSTVILDGFRKERMCVRNQERKKKKV